ncbi:PCYCGC domain-containing protein [Bacillus carboniphilus]|uniref:PCYCGC domain-containing protein n=1 Tax=Bacillus carboniphilus TaxID=86663 RepID=A0ABN0VRD9_9BACI
MKSSKRLFLILLVGMLWLSGCASKSINQMDTEQNEQENHESIPDTQEKTAAINELPSFLEGQTERTINIYAGVAKFPDLVQLVPCYCGCMETLGHQSNLNCFIQRINQDGTVVWTDHATRCETCLDIAATTIYEMNNGKTIKDVREIINQKYNQ